MNFKKVCKKITTPVRVNACFMLLTCLRDLMNWRIMWSLPITPDRLKIVFYNYILFLFIFLFFFIFYVLSFLSFLSSIFISLNNIFLILLTTNSLLTIFIYFFYVINYIYFLFFNNLNITNANITNVNITNFIFIFLYFF